MDIKDVKNLREIMAKERELRKCIANEIPFEDEELHISTGDLLRSYSANRKICEEFFPREIRKISRMVVFNFGKISSWEASEKMAFLGFSPANIYEALIGLGKTGMKGDFFISGSPLDPEEVMTTFPMIKINGGRTVTLNVDLKIEERFFVGVELVKEEKEKEVV